MTDDTLGSNWTTTYSGPGSGQLQTDGRTTWVNPECNGVINWGLTWPKMYEPPAKPRWWPPYPENRRLPLRTEDV